MGKKCLCLYVNKFACMFIGVRNKKTSSASGATCSVRFQHWLTKVKSTYTACYTTYTCVYVCVSLCVLCAYVCVCVCVCPCNCPELEAVVPIHLVPAVCYQNLPLCLSLSHTHTHTHTHTLGSAWNNFGLLMRFIKQTILSAIHQGIFPGCCNYCFFRRFGCFFRKTKCCHVRRCCHFSVNFGVLNEWCGDDGCWKQTITQ